MHAGAEYLEPLLEQGAVLVRPQHVEDRAGGHRGVRHDHVGTRAVQRGDVPFQGCTADDLQFRPQAVTKDGEIDVQIVTVGGDDDGGSLVNAGPHERVAIRGASEDVMRILPAGPLIVLHDPIVDLALLQDLRRRAADPTRAKDQHRARRCLAPLAGHQLVVPAELRLRTREDEHRIGGYPSVRVQESGISPVPQPDHRHARDFPEPAFTQGFAFQERSR
ncbi:MAG: hypothetical protein MZV64_70500 [Ignavibacteriales bacterium]|nr:hypothetical protein [Ignavibacteriales bacterium]